VAGLVKARLATENVVLADPVPLVWSCAVIVNRFDPAPLVASVGACIRTENVPVLLAVAAFDASPALSAIKSPGVKPLPATAISEPIVG
jgi:hypothetical protein